MLSLLDGDVGLGGVAVSRGVGFAGVGCRRVRLGLDLAPGRVAVGRALPHLALERLQFGVDRAVGAELVEFAVDLVLVGEGVVERALSDRDEIDRELDQLSTDSAVDAELETLKGEMGQGSTNGDATGSEVETDSETVTADTGDADAATDGDAPEADISVEEKIEQSEVEAELEELKEDEQ